MQINLEKLNQLNQENAANPGKIAAIYDWPTETEKFLYRKEDFNPRTQDLLITQIWTTEQADLVQTKINQLTTFVKESIDLDTSTDVLELIRLYEMQVEWLTNTLDYAVTTSD